MNISKKSVTSGFLRALADAVDALEERELKALLNSAGLKKLVANPSSRARVPAPNREAINESARKLMGDLSRIGSRDEAYFYLDGLQPTKAVLESAAKLRDIYITKQDSVELIKDKLVANVVGSRLDSDAIRNG